MKALKYIFFALTLCIWSACGSDDEPDPQPCDLDLALDHFDLITEDMDVDDIVAIAGNFTSSAVSDNASSYSWGYCDDSNLFMSVVYNADVLASKIRSFSNTSCNEKITQESFDAITITDMFVSGNTIAEVRALFGDDGDNYRTFYPQGNTTVTTATIVWYQCGDTNTRIEVVFEDGVAISKEESL